MRQIFIIFAAVYLLLSCNVRTEQKKQAKEVKDDFYIKERGLDMIRLPLIKPYEVLRLNGSNEWIMNLEAGTLQFSVSNVKEVNVIDSIIVVHSSDITYLRGEKVGNAWFIIKPSQQSEQGFTVESEFLSELKNQGINKPVFYNIDELYKEFVETGKLRW